MTDPVTGVVCPTLMAGAMGAQMLPTYNKKDDDIPWWDILRDYYLFPSDYTHIIDDLLSTTRGEMTQKRIISKHKKRPDVGYHYFYFNKKKDRWLFERYFKYVKLEKKRRDVNNEEQSYYRCYVLPGQTHVFDKMIELIFIADSNSVRVISINTSGGVPTPIHITEKYFQPRPYQKKCVDHIISEYSADKHKNYKVILSGERGTGKTLTARMVKKELERKYNTAVVKLYSDFDPSTVAVDVKSLILTQADKTSPVIIVIDEIDEMFKEVYRDKQIFDPRTLHTKNRLTFNAMMDAIANTPYTILIGTTEKKIEELYETEQYHSFMRRGRIDGFIEMDHDFNKVKFLKHDDINECKDKKYNAAQYYNLHNIEEYEVIEDKKKK